MSQSQADPTRSRPGRDAIEETTLLARIAREVADGVDDRFFDHMVSTLARHLNLDLFYVGEYEEGPTRRIRTLATVNHGHLQPELVYELPHTPCEVTLSESTLIIPEGAQARFPEDELLVELQVEGYIGIALYDSRGDVVGIMVGLTHQPIQHPELTARVMRVFASWATLELKRQLIDYELHENATRYRALFNLASDAIFLMQEDRFIDCNERTLEMFGCKWEDIVGTRPSEFSPPVQPDGRDSVEKAREKITAAYRGEPQFFEWQHSRLDGTVFDAEVSLNVVSFEDQDLLQAIVRNVTARKRADASLRESEHQLRLRNEHLQVINSLATQLQQVRTIPRIASETVRVLESLSNAPQVAFYLMSPAKTELRLVSDHGFDDATRQAGMTLPLEGSLSGLVAREQQLFVCTDVKNDDRLEPRVQAHLIKAGYASAVVIPVIAHDETLGTISLVFKEALPLKEADLDTLRTIGTTVSLAIANVRHIEGLRYQALHDPLTGLLNRTALHNDCRDAIEAARQRDGHVALMLLDLDRFKEVNDTLGHKVGDELLRHIGPRVQQSLNHHGSGCYRLGGDEFAILLKDVANPDDASRLGELVIQAVRLPFEAGGMNLEIGGSIGVAVFPEHGTDSHALLRCADVAMYAAKHAAKPVAQYHPDLDANTPERLTLIGELGTAIRENRLELHYQPKIDLAHHQIIGCEALVRWNHPTLGLIPPSKFIPLAEMSDLIQPLTYLVVEKALSQLSRWQSEGFNLSVSVNLSVRNLLDQGCASKLEQLFEAFPADPSMLELEITETALMSDPDRALEQIQRISAFGVRLSIDDFGTGYSSLSYLKRLPLHSLKIDRSFVSDMLQDEQDLIIVRSTINLAHSLGLDVVAEGVEDRATAEALRALDCDFAQGFYYNRPVPPQTLLSWAEHNERGVALARRDS